MISIRKRILYLTVFIIAILMLGNIYLIFQNNQRIEDNIAIQQETERVKLVTLDVIRSLHLLDLGLRGRALINNDQILAAYDSASLYLDRDLKELTSLLQKQGFDMNKYIEFRSTVENYRLLTERMKTDIENDRTAEFIEQLKDDPGFPVYLDYLDFSEQIHQFEDNIATEAVRQYQLALRNSFLLQVLLFIITIPTIGYTVYYTLRTFRVSEDLRKAEMENGRILLEQKQNLQEMVTERTKVNKELVEQNSRLQQFAYIVSHNIRAPIARMIGLATIANSSKDKEEMLDIANRLSISAKELDEVINDLGSILDIQKLDTNSLKEIHLSTVVDKVCKLYSTDIRETNCRIHKDFSECPDIVSLPQYIESILFNLLSNSIKYRHKDRDPEIHISCRKDGNTYLLEFRDNGMGIDLNKYGNDLFGLYKRFHFHVEGKGMGLYLIKTQIEALGGTISLESNLDKGTIFRVVLPRPVGG